MQEIEEEFKDQNVRVLGILADKEVEMGKVIMSKQKGEYVNIVPTESLIPGFLDKIMYVPTSLLVNDKGEMVGEMIVGSKTFESFSKLIKNAIEE